MKNQYYVADILSVVPFCSLDIVSNMGMKVWEMVNLCHRWSGTKCLVTVSSSLKKQQNACSGPSLVYQVCAKIGPLKKPLSSFLPCWFLLYGSLLHIHDWRENQILGHL